MATRYLIGRGELLTQPIDAPKKRIGEKRRPYSLSDAKVALLPQISETANAIDALPVNACPDNTAVAKFVLHPAFIAKSYFPEGLLRHVGLTAVGSRTTRVKPRRKVRDKSPDQADTTEIFVAGPRERFRHLREVVAALPDRTPEGDQFAELEHIAPMQPTDRLQPATGFKGKVFEVGLHMLPSGDEQRTRMLFNAYAAQLGFKVHPDLVFQSGRLLFLAVEGPLARIQALAEFSLVRVIRPMPTLRGLPTMRTTVAGSAVQIPTSPPLSTEPKVAILDGGLPSKHVLARFVRDHYLSDPNAKGVSTFTDHGLGVTSAFLFGPIAANEVLSRPFSPVDHYRVLDHESTRENPYDLYRTLAHIETVLQSRNYEFINLSVGPELPMADNDVHAWTAVIDTLLSDGSTLMTVAIGNNGQSDRHTRLDRIQVPSDAVNVLSIGAANTRGEEWKRASYSARGPGRTPGRRKPDALAFGGDGDEYFHHIASSATPKRQPNQGTSFAAPLALRTAVGVSAILGSEIRPLTIRALLVHCCDRDQRHDPDEVGWGRIPEDVNQVITCDGDTARIVYQGVLRPGKFLRAPLPLPNKELVGRATLTATFCYATPVDPEDAGAYTKAGLVVTFRPNEEKRKAGSSIATSKPFFQPKDFRSEQEERDDLGKWEPVLHASHTYFGSTLKGATFDIHYNAREGGAAVSGAPSIPYALVVSIRAPKHETLYEDILAHHSRLKVLEPQIAVPIRV